ncbi:MAG: methyltransferase domain-containing protein [Planctomycetales bacterium]|nr:methyltransferase domain-containing protein [Planctomycetales bacterium]
MSPSLKQPFSTPPREHAAAGATMLAPAQQRRTPAALARCPCCNQAGADAPFYAVDSLPIHSCLLVETQAAARSFPRGSLALHRCAACGFIWNARFEQDRMRYAPDYEEVQTCSPKFQAFQSGLVKRLTARHRLYGRRIVEIGCGKGDFLRELCRHAQATGVGIDPSYRGPLSLADEDITFLREHYGAQHASIEADFVCCRHTLEHIPDPFDFMRLIVESLRGRAEPIVFVEVPDMRRVLTEGAFWDVYYEHCSYFTAGSLTRLFHAVGLEVMDVAYDFDEQYLLVEGRLAPEAELADPADDAAEPVSDWAADFACCVDRQLSELAAFLQPHFDARRQVVLWGGGSKAVSLLTSLPQRDRIRHVVDVNPVKHGKFIPGGGQEVVAPDALRRLRPDVVVVMNDIYREEISATLCELGLHPELIALH